MRTKYLGLECEGVILDRTGITKAFVKLPSLDEEVMVTNFFLPKVADPVGEPIFVGGEIKGKNFVISAEGKEYTIPMQNLRLIDASESREICAGYSEEIREAWTRDEIIVHIAEHFNIEQEEVSDEQVSDFCDSFCDKVRDGVFLSEILSEVTSPEMSDEPEM